LGYVEELRALIGHRPIILAGAVVFVIDRDGKILLQQCKHPAGYWAVPGGIMELGESVEDTARRELYEETRLQAGTLHLINVYSGPQYFSVAPNGDRFYTVTTAFYTTEITGDLVVDPLESLDFRFFRPDALPENIVETHRQMLRDFLDHHYDKIIKAMS
jgi:ADP-ribose pyrophosphatase YjhB (NUDIX family)